MTKDPKDPSGEDLAKLLKEAGTAAEQLARTKKLRNTAQSMVESNDDTLVKALKELLKQK